MSAPPVTAAAIANDQRSSRKRHLLGFGAVAALALLLVALAINAFATGHARREAEEWQVHTLKVLLATEHVRSAANQALRGERGFLITGYPRFLQAYHEGSRAAVVRAGELGALTQDNPVQRPHVAALRAQLERYLAALDDTVKLTGDGRRQDAVAVTRSGIGRREIESLLAILARIEGEERRLLAERETASRRAGNAAEIAAFTLSGLALVFLLIIAWAGVTASRARLRTLEMEEQLRRAATTDDLTGLLNRRAFLAALDTEVARSARSGAPLALALIDLDHFKSINDRFGHHGGDAVLRRFAEITRETMRTADVIGRIGGEEFAVLMPDTDQVQSGVAGERLRDMIERRHIILESGALVPLTVSVGVAHHISGEGRDRLIIRADEALYEAKETGRNRTRLAA